MEEDLDGWGATDTPNDGYASEEELNVQKLISSQNKKKSKSGGFQAMGLSKPVLNGILRKGYKVPTPIQRRTIPIILDGKDVVAMARTGSGKTAAFLIPLFEKLKLHSAQMGARALILSPTRELALQTLTFAKEIGKFTALRAATILGGESMDGQFAALHENPDIIIATPGRFVHICIEMNLKLSTVEYVVFDEADRLFEMGFMEQLKDIMNRLSPERQTLLFSATLPKILVDFARAGLTDPVLLRLDVDTKISDNLKLGFFRVNNEDKLPLLLHILSNVIQKTEQTVVFAETKYHVEFIHQVLNEVGIPNTYIYSALDPAARKINTAKFRAHKVNILIVTDLAARGIDIPLLDNVINYNFPPKTKLFVHRVGRVARAGRKGTAYSFVSPDEISHLLELHMFLSRSIKLAPYPLPEDRFLDWDRMFGRVPQDVLDENADFINKLVERSFELQNLKKSSKNASMKYMKSRPISSAESSRRLKEEIWDVELGFHPLFVQSMYPLLGPSQKQDLEVKRVNMLEMLKNLRHKSTVFEMNHNRKDGNRTPALICMEEKRKLDDGRIEIHHQELMKKKEARAERRLQDTMAEAQRANLEKSSEVDVAAAFNVVIGKRKRRLEDKKVEKTSLDTEDKAKDYFIPYRPGDYYSEQGYSVVSNFERESAGASFDLIGDDKDTLVKPVQKWDRKNKKYVGEEKIKKIKTESGVWVAASYKQDLYEKWKLKMQPNQNNVEGDSEDEGEHEEKTKRQKQMKNSDKQQFQTLNENWRYKAHPLLKGKKDKTEIVKGDGAPRQVKSFEQKIKDRKTIENKHKFDKARELVRKKKRFTAKNRTKSKRKFY